MLPVVLSMYGPTAPPNVRGSSAHIPRGSRSPSWMLDKQHAVSASSYFGSPSAAASSEAVGGGYYDLHSGAPGGALGWSWGGGGDGVHGSNSGWEKSGEFAMDGSRENGYRRGDVMGGSNNSGTGLSLPPATLSQDDLVQ